MPKIFLSYSHDSEAHKSRVHQLADRLRADGMDITMDRDCGPGGPDEGWPKWSEQQAEHSATVLLVITQTYQNCWEGINTPGMRLGATHEARVLHQRIYNSGQKIAFARPIIFDECDKDFIPLTMAGLQIFQVDRDYASLLAWLKTRQPANTVIEQSPDISWPSSLQPISACDWPMANRRDCLELFTSMLTRQRHERLLLLEGGSNMGKSVLIKSLLGMLKSSGLNGALLDLKGCIGLEDMLENLSLEIDQTVLPNFHKSSSGERKTGLLKDLEHLAAPLFLGIDTYQQGANSKTADWIESQLLARLERFSRLILVIGGQLLPDPWALPCASLSVKHTLQPICDKSDWLDFARRVLNQHSTNEAHIEMLVHVCKGNPGQASSLLRTFAT